MTRKQIALSYKDNKSLHLVLMLLDQNTNRIKRWIAQTLDLKIQNEQLDKINLKTIGIELE